MTHPDELLSRHKAALPSWTPSSSSRWKPRGEGFRVWDSEGNEYLDFFGGIVDHRQPRRAGYRRGHKEWWTRSCTPPRSI